MTYGEKCIAVAEDHELARELARSLPRPNTVRQLDDGKWGVMQLLPAKWSPVGDRAATG